MSNPEQSLSPGPGIPDKKQHFGAGTRHTESDQAVPDQLTSSSDSKKQSIPEGLYPWLHSGTHGQSLSDGYRVGDAHLKPLSFPEKSGGVPPCFLSQESDLPIQCLLCAAVFSLPEPMADIVSPSEAAPKAGSSPGGMETSPQSKNMCSSDPSNFDPQETGQGVSKNKCGSDGHQNEGVVAAQSTRKPPKAKLTPKDEWLRHLLLEHKIVIHNVEEISSLKWYSEYWKKRLQEAPITEFAPVIRTNTDSDFPSEDYYLFSKALPEEKSLRHYLHKKRLEAVLEVQQREREDSEFSRRCLFCSQVASGNRRNLFQHMLDNHSFNVGQPDNLVFVKEFLDLLQEKLDSLQCLFCERTFRDRVTLKDHMRKKGHKKINSQNKVYDRFYVINYLELGRTWEEVHGEDDREAGFTEESDWVEEPSPLTDSVYCLFCVIPQTSTGSALSHMKEAHGFNLPSLCAELGLDYYSQIKLVNFVRRKVHSNSCVYCGHQCSSLPHLLDHMTSSSHFMLPSNRAKWDQPQYLFPTYENDSLLYGLDDDFS